MTIENRLKEERLRLGFTQPDFAALGEKTKKTLIDYEKGATSPDAKFLAAIAAAGADVAYILTGMRANAAPGTEAGSGKGEEKKTEADRLKLEAEVLAGILEGVETSLAKRKLKLPSAAKAQLVIALYVHFKAIGRPSLAQVEQQLNLTS